MIEQQLALEREMIQSGAYRFHANTSEAEYLERGSETSYARVLIPEYFSYLVNEVEFWMANKGIGLMHKYKSLLTSVTAEQATWITLRCLFNVIMSDRGLAYLATSIGKAIEHEQRFQRFQKAMPNYVDNILDRWRKSNTQDVERKYTSMSQLMKLHNIPYNPWTQQERVYVGLGLLKCVRDCSNIITIQTKSINGKRRQVVTPTKECLEWIFTHTDIMAMLSPDLMPCIVKPDNWTSVESGGYYSPQLREQVPMVKHRNQQHKDMLLKADMPVVYNTANILQNTPWEVNTDILSIIHEVWNKNLMLGLPGTRPITIPKCPVDVEDRSLLTEEEEALLKEWKVQASLLHSAEKERVGRCLQTVRVLRTARKMAEYSALYFPVQMDFRGRMYYTTAGMSPQGADMGKGLLRFHEGKPLNTDTAVQWFLVHGANCYGFDKESYDARVKFISDNHQNILNTADDPINWREMWSNADDPWRFLAWCLEYRDFHAKGRKFISKLPIAMDGSCNGLQHFSALLRDEIGGAATNLVPMDAPADIYRVVADKVTEVLKTRNDDLAKLWLEYGVTRKVTKRPVMTLPYGSTRRTCVDNILESVMEHGHEVFEGRMFEAAIYLGPVVWEAIGETVVAARAAMDWLRDVARDLARAGVPMEWVAPSGFPVMHAMYTVDVRRVKTVLDTSMSLGKFTDKLCVLKQKSGASPNFVHSLDASHLCYTVSRAQADGACSISCVHDSFGTHAADADVLYTAIREEFVNMYETYDPLMDLYDTASLITDIKLPPNHGNLDIGKVLESKYFFT